jgi:hypothetical protein
MIVLVWLGAGAWAAHQNLETINNISMRDVFKQGRCRIEAVQHTTRYRDGCKSWHSGHGENSDCNAQDAACWDQYYYQFYQGNSSLLTTYPEVEQHFRNHGEGNYYIPQLASRCPDEAPTVVPSNFTKGQEVDCWIPKKLPVDDSVWGSCTTVGCVHLFYPEAERKAVMRHNTNIFYEDLFWMAIVLVCGVYMWYWVAGGGSVSEEFWPRSSGFDSA